MITKYAFRIFAPLALAIVAFATPADAMTVISETAAFAMDWAIEIAVVAAVIAGLIILDMTSWSLMTPNE